MTVERLPVPDAGVLLGLRAIADYLGCTKDEARRAPMARCKDGTPVSAKPVLDAWRAANTARP